MISPLFRRLGGERHSRFLMFLLSHVLSLCRLCTEYTQHVVMLEEALAQ